MKWQESISVIIPVYNEAENIVQLHYEITKVMELNFVNYEIIFIDDGSTDETLTILSQINNLNVIKLSKNYGQTAAMRAGIKAAKMQYLVFLDGDGQNDPSDIPSMFSRLKELGIDCICGWRKNRNDKFLKRFVSRIAEKLRRKIIPDGIHDAGCTLKIMTAEAGSSLELLGELHRFIPSMLKMNGFTLGEIKVNHRPRNFGRTKYGWKRMFKGYLDMVGLWFWNRYAARPLHFFGALTFIFSISGWCLVILGAVSYFFFDQTFSKFLPAAGFLLIIQGGQFFVTGLIAQFLSRTFYLNTKEEPFRIIDPHKAM